MIDCSVRRVAFAMDLLFVGLILLVMAMCIHYLLNPPQYDTELANGLDQNVAEVTTDSLAVETTGEASVIEVPEDSAVLKIVDNNGNTMFQIVVEDTGV